MKRISLVLALAALGAGVSLFAQDPNYSGDQPPGPGGAANYNGDQPGPGGAVARISVVNGDVSIRRGDSGDVVAAALNAPLVVQDRLLTSSSSRAELQFDSSNILRVGSKAEVRLTGMDYKNYQIQVAIGTVTFTSLRSGDGQVELDTPSVSLRPLKAGAYRITVHEDGSSEITVRSGEAEVYSPAGSEKLAQGQTMLARGNPSDPEFQITQAAAYDSWDRWNEERDRYITQARSRQYVNHDINGAEDLDQYGRWVNDPTYGNVWAPTVGPDWAPYREGRWVWEDFYGWTWVSYDPWGWAPYHYGRWFHGPVGWCWYPGPVYVHSYWSPAIVGFFGWGGGGGFGFGFGNIGWVPLAPFEPFHPWWGRGFGGGYGYGRGFNNTTIVNNVNINNVYRNARVNGGLTSVSAAGFGRHNAQFVGVNGQQIGNAGLVRGMAPVTPDRASLRFADRQVNAGAFPQSRNERFFSHNQPSAVQRTPFDQQQRVMSQRFGGPGSQVMGANGGAPNQGGFGRSSGPGAPTAGWRSAGGPAAQPGAPGSHQWSRFGEPIHGAGPGSVGAPPQANFGPGRMQAPGAPATRSVGPENGGWRRFGSPSGAGVPRQQEMTPRGFGGPQSPAPQNSGGRNLQQFNTPRSVNPEPRSFQPGPGGPPSEGSRWGGSAPVGIRPPMVRERSQSGFGGGGSFSEPRGYSAPPSQPRYESPRSFGGGGSFSEPRGYSAPRNYAPPSQPRYEAPRNFGGGGGFSGSRGYSAPPSQPRYEAPRGGGGGGGGGFGRGGGGGFSGGGRSSGGHNGGGNNGGGGHHGR